MDFDSLIGQSVAQYKILSKLGEGGMGIVYKALDTRLDRAAALKLLPADKMSDPHAKTRLAQEARTASALNHPNIVTIYDIGESSGFLYIAMEYVTGKTLSRVIAGKGLGVAETLRYAVQVADALAAAHEAGIVHRDLKPGNIMITDRGLVKLLDFGLAKVAGPSPPDEVTRTMAKDGTVIGTAAYMSPEQAVDEVVDARSDIFSFGVVLYEMLTGRRPFAGVNNVATLAAVLQAEPPPLVEAAPDTPDELARLIHRCLRKEPDRRPQHMDDLKMMLEELKPDSPSSRMLSLRSLAPVRPPTSGWSRRKLWGSAILAVLIATAGIVAWRSRAPRNVLPPVLDRLTSDAGFTAFPALSPDGKLLAYASDRQGTGNLDIWVQQVGGGEPVRRTADDADDYAPSFSPDGTEIVFRSEKEGGGIYMTGALAGEARLVAAGGHEPVFSPDGAWIAYWLGAIDTGVIPGSAKLYVIPAAGGQARQVQPRFFAARHPVWLRDGTRLLFYGRIAGEQGEDWWVAPVEGGTAVRTGAFAVFQRQGLKPPPGEYVITPGALSADDQVVFSAASGDSTNLWKIALSPRSGHVADQAMQVTFGTGLEMQPALTASGAKLVFTSLNLNVDVWALPADTDRGRVTSGRERLTQGTAEHALAPAISDDGQKLVYVSRRSGASNVWMKDLITGQESAITTGNREKTQPKISGDGQKVVYDQRDQERNLFLTSSKGGPAVNFCAVDCPVATAISADGSWILGEGEKTAVLMDVRSGTKVDIILRPERPSFFPFSAAFSPDERWISFHVRDGNPATREIYVAPFHGAQAISRNEWIPITDGKNLDRETHWSPDGNLLYFMSDRDGFRCIWAQRLEPRTKRPAGPAFAVAHFHHARSSLSVIAASRVGLSVIRGKIVFAMGDLTGNIWARVPR